jgi:hypothetical protein
VSDETKCKCEHPQSAHILDADGYWCSMQWLSDSSAGARTKYMCACEQFEPVAAPGREKEGD